MLYVVYNDDDNYTENSEILGLSVVRVFILLT